MNYEQ
jgi:hypothetical protein